MTLETHELIGGGALLAICVAVMKWLHWRWRICRARVKLLIELLARCERFDRTPPADRIDR